MMYRFLFTGAAGEGFSHCEHRRYPCDADAMMAGRHRLNSRPLASRVDIYRMAGDDTCGLMSHVVSYKK